jgi:ligand-binding sensor domain-containing protein/signal transduction histidine kinase
MIPAGWQRRALWAWLLALSQVAMGLDPQRSLDHYGHQAWRTDSGLPQNTVHSILQTRDGYLWLATDGGLVRCNGVDFVTFDAENTPQFSSDTVYDLLQDESGTLWISTAGGLVAYRGGGFAAYTTAQGLPADTVWFSYQDRHHRLWAFTAAGPAVLAGSGFAPVRGAQAAAPLNRRALAEDAGGRLWLGGSSGVFGLDTTLSGPRVALHLLSGSEVEAVQLDPAGKLWIGTQDGLERYSGGSLVPVPIAHLRQPAVTALDPDATGGMWVATSSGLAHINSSGAILQPASSAQSIEQIFRDREGVLWMASEHGLFRLEHNQLQSFGPASALAGKRILALYEDREGSLWVGTDSGGLHILRDQKFTTLTTADGLSGNLVRCVFASARGELWIGTDGAGLNRRTSDGFAHITAADGLSSNVILALADAPGGDLWVGTPDGLNLLHLRKPGHVDRFTTADGLPDDFVRSLYTDRDGSLWIGTRHGLAHLSGGKVTGYSRMDGLGSDFIGAIFRGGNGDLWMGTAGGLSRFHDGAFTNYTRQQGLSNNVVTAIAQNSEGALWLGTNGGGLNRLRPASAGGVLGAIQPFPYHARGLPGTIYGILEDASAHLWLASQTGIYRVAEAQLNAYAAGTTHTIPVDGYGTADGMNIRECSGDGHPAAWKLDDGSLWFATLEGVSFILPGRAAENRMPPPTAIEKVLVDDQAHRLDSPELNIPPGANRLELQYAGLSFVAPQKVQYRYQLQGFDRGWIDAGSRRAAFYTNLPPGNYRFRVQAANNDGVWNTDGAAIALRLLPHFYQTNWFYGALALAALLLGYLAYRWRVRQVEAQWGAVLAERGRLAREIHDTLAQGFVAVSVQLEVVARLLGGSREPAPKPVTDQLDQTRALVRASLAEARTSIWDLRSQAAGSEDLPSRLRQSCSRVSSGSPSRVYLQVKGTYRPLESKMEEELLRIGQEAVVNAVRHAGATRIDVQLIYEAARVSLRVADDGRGFLANGGHPEGHYGIRGMHERAAEIDAALVVESTPGGGTRVSVEAPVGGR